VGGVVQHLEQQRAGALVHGGGGDPAEVVGDALGHVGAQQALPPGARLGAAVEVLHQPRVRAEALLRVPAELDHPGEHAITALHGGGGQPAQRELLRGGRRDPGVLGEPVERDVLEVRDEPEQLDGVRRLGGVLGRLGHPAIVAPPVCWHELRARTRPGGGEARRTVVAP
jgi:hypothetical protein